MTKVARLKKSRDLILLQVLGIGLILSFQNCSKGVLQNQTETYGLSSEGIVPTSEAKTVGVSGSETILTSLVSVTGIQAPSTGLFRSSAGRTTLIGDTGAADSVNAPMWISITNLSGDVCAQLVTEEKAKAPALRRIFKEIDFTKGPDSVSQEAKDKMIRRMARAYWGRNEEKEELAAINDSLSENFKGVDMVQTELQVLFGCSAMLSSASAHIR